MGVSLGCLAPALTIAACLSYRPPFATTFNQEDAIARAKAALVAPGLFALHRAEVASPI